MPELRKDPIVGRWVIISTERARRPIDFTPDHTSIRPDAFCAFCPGHEDKTPPEVLAYREPHTSRANGPGWNLRVVPNKFPALRVEGQLDREGEGIYDKMNGIGAHEVIIESPRHVTSMAELDERAFESVMLAYRDRISDLKRDLRFRYVMVFKNHGATAGASLEHSHSQLIALPVVPVRVAEEVDGAKRWYDLKERCIFCDIVRQELNDGRRVVYENDGFAVIEPFAPKLPFETLLLPKFHASHYEDLPRERFGQLANAMRVTMRKLATALDDPPYNFMLHTAPIGDKMPHYHWHIEIMPTLTQVAGFEWGSGFYINPTPPEDAAAFLRDLAV